MNLYDRIYKHLPVSIQNFVVSTYGLYWYWLRFGGNYKTFEKGYLERDRYYKQQYDLYQQESLHQLLSICVNEIPFYRENWSQSQKQAALNGMLTELPLLEKDPIRANPYAFTRQGKKPFPLVVAATSGSTGTPIKTLWSVSEVRDSLAVREVRSARWAGVSFKIPRATFSGRMVEPDPESKGPFYRFNQVEKQVYFSAFHLRPDTAHFYVAALRKHNIQWMTGYAVSFYLLAKFILEKGLDVPPLKAIITTSEKLTPEMRQVMQKAYGCRIYEEYSTVENALFASECEHGRLHVSPDVGIVEILRPDGSPCDPGEVGEVVTTCLMRSYQIFIRYRLGDLAAWDPVPCPCGREMPVIKEVVGRLEDVVVGPDGRQMVRFHGIFVNQLHVIEGQIIQEALDLIRVKVVPTEGFDQLDEIDIKKRIEQRLGESVKVIVETVSEIPRTKAGKFKAVISNLNSNNSK
jgi:phenylacetate-CoA ligase